MTALTWGDWPERRDDDAPRAWRWPGEAVARRRCRAIAGDAARQAVALDPAHLAAAARAAGHRLRREGFTPGAIAQALAVALAAAPAALGLRPHLPQQLAAAALLDQRLAEMATGEGKTLATALAAAAGALSGLPVHVATANDYLAARDAAQMAPLFAALGLRAACLPPHGAVADESPRRAAYGADIVYATARSFAFDDLRDRARGALPAAPLRHAAALAGRPAPAPLMRGLGLALIDEADSILLDEADLPLVLSQPVPQAERRAFLWQALALARALRPGEDFTLHVDERRTRLTPTGEARAAEACVGLGAAWQRPRWRREALQTALVALHALARDRHYLVREGRLALLDEVTGRVAEGRQWSRGLHALVQLKEGLAPDDDTQTLARTSYARFFARYQRLGGTSGTLWEARRELAAVYGTPVLRVPRAQPERRHSGPMRVFASEAALHAALVAHIGPLHRAGRPVLVGTDSLAESDALAAALAAAGLPCQVLDARHDVEEAERVAHAGARGAITVATRMAGRGTDIALDAEARDAGGLHVFNCQRNASARLDRQLLGRAARQGDPGSGQAWWTPRNPALARAAGGPLGPILGGCDSTGLIPRAALACAQPWLRWSRAWLQAREERRRAAARARLLAEDRRWAQRLDFDSPPP